jgi:lipopolysaccharide export system permease protein
MKLFGRYLFRQVLGALLLILLSLTGVVWIATALKQLNVVTSQGQEAWAFFQLTLLAIPNLMAIIAPVALLIAALHTINRLNSDSELIVMTASGATLWYFARPLLLLAALVSATVLAFNVLVMPWSARTLQVMIIKMRTDLIAQVIQPGRFSSPESGLTFHIRDRDQRTGQILGLLMHDAREPEHSSSYLAERGDIVKEGADAFLIMHNGHFIRRSQSEPIPRLVKFERYVIDLVRFKPKEEGAERKPRERSLAELWTLTPKDREEPKVEGKLRAELHDRLSSPLYPFAFVLIVLAAVGVAQSTRQNRMQNLVSAFVIAAGARIMGFAATNLVAINANAKWTVYAIPLTAIFGAILVAALRARPRRRSALAQRLEGLNDRSRAGLRRMLPRRPRSAAGPA